MRHARNGVHHAAPSRCHGCTVHLRQPGSAGTRRRFGCTPSVASAPLSHLDLSEGISADGHGDGRLEGLRRQLAPVLGLDVVHQRALPDVNLVAHRAFPTVSLAVRHEQVPVQQLLASEVLRAPRLGAMLPGAQTVLGVDVPPVMLLSLELTRRLANRASTPCGVSI